MAEECLSCVHLFMASAERTLIPVGSRGLLDHSRQPCIVGIKFLNFGLGPKPTSQKSKRVGCGLRMSSFLTGPICKVSPSAGAIENMTRRRSLIRLSSQKSMESLFLRFSRAAPLTRERPLHGKPPVKRIAAALRRRASATKVIAHSLSMSRISSNNVSMMLF